MCIRDSYITADATGPKHLDLTLTRAKFDQLTANLVEAYEYTRRMIDIFNHDGGFVFNQEHNIMPDVPAANILAMYQAVADSRK